MVETDSPYLAPVPYRGKKNEPSFVVEMAKRVDFRLRLACDERPDRPRGVVQVRQPGHLSQKRERLPSEQVDRVIDMPPPERCNSCAWLQCDCVHPAVAGRVPAWRRLPSVRQLPVGGPLGDPGGIAARAAHRASSGVELR